MSPRWRKVRADLIRRPSRTVLATLSLVVGVFTVGSIQLATDDIQRSFGQAFRDSNPPSVVMATDPFGPELVEEVRDLEAVGEVEARRRLSARVQPAAAEWANVELVAMPDFTANRIGLIRSEDGAWPPADGAIVFERASADELGVTIGEQVLVEVPGQGPLTLEVQGTAHDVREIPPMFGGVPRAYVSIATVEQISGSRMLNALYLRAAEDPLDRDQALALSATVRDQIVEPAGLAVGKSLIGEPGEHPIQRVLDALVVILRLLSVFIFVLACVLVVNTMSALLTEQRRQLGVMKAVGATARQLAGLYLVYSLVLQVVALAVSIPLLLLAGRAMAGFFALLLNVDLLPLGMPWSTLALVSVVAVVIPSVAVLWAVAGASKRTVRESISDYGLASGSTGGLAARVRVLRTPWRLGLRNTFRNRARLALTVTTLALTGALFIGLLSTDRALGRIGDQIAGYTDYDLELAFTEPVAIDDVQALVAERPEVSGAEGWLRRDAFRIRSDGTENENVFLVGLPPDSRSVDPTLTRGRWLTADDELAIVVNEDLLREETDLAIGGQVELHIEGQRVTWEIVGSVTTQLIGPIAYVPAESLADLTGNTGRADLLAVNLAAGADPVKAAADLERVLPEAGVPLGGVQTNADIRAQTQGLFDILVWTLLIVAALLGVVAVVGVTGTMTLAVLERTREIGVLRTVGATGGAIRRVLLTEGLTLGVLGWVLGGLVGVPMAWLLGQVIGRTFLYTPLPFTYSWMAVAIWLGATLLIGAIGAMRPAYSAARLTIRETLAYE